jgi:3-methyladenine DNA glycosylase AlkD
MRTWAQGCVASVVSGLADAAVTADAAPMSAYVRHQFPFLGVKAPARKAVVRTALAAAGPPVDEVEVVDAVDRLWTLPEREYRYAGCLLADRFAPAASPAFIDHLSRWITADPWWDTCDPLARGCTGKLVRRHPELRPTMDRWLSGDDLWLTRSALIHMGGWKHAIDREWVLEACLARADHPDFFIRKAIGWILRDLARAEPRAVVAFVEGKGATVLSELSKREALKNISLRPAGAAPTEPVPQGSDPCSARCVPTHKASRQRIGVYPPACASDILDP